LKKGIDKQKNKWYNAPCRSKRLSLLTVNALWQVNNKSRNKVQENLIKFRAI